MLFSYYSAWNAIFDGEDFFFISKTFFPSPTNKKRFMSAIVGTFCTHIKIYFKLYYA